MIREKNDKSQLDRFKEAARDLGCDESEEAFDAALKQIGKAPPPTPDKPSKDKPGR
jgi:hypothetical protein